MAQRLHGLYTEVEIQIYEELVAGSPRLARMKSPDELRTVQPDERGLRLALQLNQASRAIALRYLAQLAQDSIPWTHKSRMLRQGAPLYKSVITSLDLVRFNRHNDTVYFDAWDGNAVGVLWGPHNPGRAVQALVLGAQYPNIMITLSYLIEHSIPMPSQQPVEAAMSLLTNRMNIGFASYFTRLTAPQFPRNLYLVLEGGNHDGRQAINGLVHPRARDQITLAGMTDEVQRALHPYDRAQVQIFLACWAGWREQFPDLQLSNVFFVLPTWTQNQ